MNTILDKITLLIPCYNEQEVLEQLWLRLNTILGEISAVSFEILFHQQRQHRQYAACYQEARVSIRRFLIWICPVTSAKELAMIAGLDYTPTAATVIIMDADLQHPPELIPEMIAWKAYDDVLLTYFLANPFILPFICYKISF